MNKSSDGPPDFPFPTPPARGEAIEIAENILWIRMPLPMVLNHVNVFALDDGDSWTLVDTGISNDKSRGIWQNLLDGPLAGKPVKRVVATHHHLDHLGLAGWFARDHGAEIWATRTSWLMARMLQLDVHERPTEETLLLWQRAGMRADILEARRKSRPFNTADGVYPIPLGFTRLVEGQTITMGGRNWTVRFGQGHAPDHATFWSQSDDLVLGGDQMLATISPNLSVYATEPEADPVGEMLAACRRLSSFATPAHLVLPGHKLPFRGLPARLQQLIAEHERALENTLAFLSENPNATAADCFTAIFGRKISDAEYGLALGEALAHLLHLYHKGRASRQVGPSGSWLWTNTGGRHAETKR